MLSKKNRANLGEFEYALIPSSGVLLRMLFTFSFVSLGWVFFRSNNIDTAGVDVAATKEKLIQDAYDDMVMKRLDSIILAGNTSEYSSNPKLKSNTGKGGIVII